MSQRSCPPTGRALAPPADRRPGRRQWGQATAIRRTLTSLLGLYICLSSLAAVFTVAVWGSGSHGHWFANRSEAIVILAVLVLLVLTPVGCVLRRRRPQLLWITRLLLGVELAMVVAGCVFFFNLPERFELALLVALGAWIMTQLQLPFLRLRDRTRWSAESQAQSAVQPSPLVSRPTAGILIRAGFSGYARTLWLMPPRRVVLYVSCTSVCGF